MTKYLVTGGAGFIGSNIVENLVSSGHAVRVVDNLSTGKLENIREFIGDIEFIEGDLTDYRVAQKAVDGVDYILHHAALSSVTLSMNEPIAVNRSIVDTTVNLFDAAVKGKTVKRIIQASSAAVYGDSPVLPKSEDMLPEPLSPYAAAKIAQENYARVFYYAYGLEVISLRYFNVFGPKQDLNSSYSGVIPIFLSKMVRGKCPVIYGDGYTSRDFVYIDNVVEANLLACSCEWTGKPEIINIGSGEEITLNGLVKMLNNILGTDLPPVYAEQRKGDIRHSIADIMKAKDILKFTNRVSFYDGLMKLVQWYKDVKL